MSKAIKAVCVWLDSTSAASEPTWIVSRDSLNERGEAETTTTLSTHETEDEAMEAGRAKAAKLGLSLYRNPEDGPAELVAEAPANDE
jgi:hypothetical protein